MRRSSYYTKRRKGRTGRKSRQRKAIYNRRMRRSVKRGAGKYNTQKSRTAKATPYKTRDTLKPSNETLLDVLSRCSKQSEKIRNAIENPSRKLCKYDQSCYRTNIEHRLSFIHTNENLGQIEVDAYLDCTNSFLDKSWELYKYNGDQLPDEWYISISTYLQTWDYNDQHHLYFNILANICQHGLKYVQKYSETFIEKLLVGMEESAVTGMFDITNRPELMKCLARINSPDDRYLSNTALLSLVKRSSDELTSEHN